MIDVDELTPIIHIAAEAHGVAGPGDVRAEGVRLRFLDASRYFDDPEADDETHVGFEAEGVAVRFVGGEPVREVGHGTGAVAVAFGVVAGGEGGRGHDFVELGLEGGGNEGIEAVAQALMAKKSRAGLEGAMVKGGLVNGV